MKELDYLGIFGEFNRKGIRYIVCGGVAVNLWGVPRMTYDIDLLLDMKETNLRAFLGLLQTWGFRSRLPVDMMDLLDGKKRMRWIEEKNMKAFSLYNPRWAISEIDVLIGLPVTYQRAAQNVIYKIVGQVEIPLISPKDLIEMKRDSERPQDRVDAQYLEKLLGREDGKNGL